MLINVGVTMDPAVLFSILGYSGLTVALNISGTKIVFQRDETETQEEEEGGHLLMDSEETTLNLEVIHHEPLEELVEHRQAVSQASIRSHG